LAEGFLLAGVAPVVTSVRMVVHIVLIRSRPLGCSGRSVKDCMCVAKGI